MGYGMVLMLRRGWLGKGGLNASTRMRADGDRSSPDDRSGHGVGPTDRAAVGLLFLSDSIRQVVSPDRHHPPPRGKNTKQTQFRTTHKKSMGCSLFPAWRDGRPAAFRSSPAFAGLFWISGAPSPEGPGDRASRTWCPFQGPRPWGWRSGRPRTTDRGVGWGPIGRHAAGLFFLATLSGRRHTRTSQQSRSEGLGRGLAHSRGEGLDDVFETCGFFWFPT